MTIQFMGAAYIADTARVVGEVELGANANIWYGVSIRGDVASVRVGQNTNVQDNAVIHCDDDVPNTIGSNVTIGHGAIVHGRSVGDGSLIGMGAVVLGSSRIGRNCLIAAGAVVPPRMEVPDGMMVMGVPGRIVREVNETEAHDMERIPRDYVRWAKMHSKNGEDPRVRAYGSEHDSR